MSFLYRPRSIHVHHHTKQLPQTPLLPAVENNVLSKKDPIRQRTNSMGPRHIIKRFSSMFSSKKKQQEQLPDFKLASNSVTDHHITAVYVASFASSSESIESVDDIRRPSGLGQAVSTMSNRSLPPSPFFSSFEGSPRTSHDYQRIRALSSPNLLLQQQQQQNKPRVNPKSKNHSISNHTIIESELPLPPLPLSPASCLPKDVTVHIFSYLPRGTIASCSQVSKSFAEAARFNLYNTLNFDFMSLLQLEQLLAVLASRRDLTELVTTFICHKWPPFFITDRHCRGGRQTTTGYIFQHKDVLLTATFTLALEGMTNITSLTLPSFDASLLAHHSAFGLKRLTFTNYTISDTDARALFAWLDGQTNIVSLRFTNLEDVVVIINIKDTTTTTSTTPHRNTICGTPKQSPPPVSPRSINFPQSPTLASPFSSPNLLPNLVELHATPSILTLLALPPPQSTSSTSPFASSSSPTTTTSPPPPPSSFPFPPSPPILRPLTTVSLNITTTLYTGLRPSTLMNQLRGVSHLCLKFGRAVDRRTFEKVVGAAGGVLGGREGGGGGGDGSAAAAGSSSSTTRIQDGGEWVGLRSLEVGFHDCSSKHSRRDEALYKALQISLPRYKSLRSLRLFVSHESFIQDRDHRLHLKHYRSGTTTTTNNENENIDSVYDISQVDVEQQQQEDDEKQQQQQQQQQEEQEEEEEEEEEDSNEDDIMTTHTPSGVEQILIDSWLKLCPSLEVVTLFSGSQWRKELDDREELWSGI